MKPTAPFRPVLAALLASSLGACGMVEADPHRFEGLAHRIASIPVDGGEAVAVIPSAVDLGLRGSATSPDTQRPLRVEVMDPHDLWDARDMGLRGAIEQSAPRLIQAAAPAVAEAALQQVSHRIAAAVPTRSAIPRRPVTTEAPTKAALVQLGAFSSEAAARTAWTRLKSGEAGRHLNDLTPVFEAVQRGNVTLTRLKAPVSATGSAAVCAAARIDAPWCQRA